MNRGRSSVLSSLSLILFSILWEIPPDEPLWWHGNREASTRWQCPQCNRKYRLISPLCVKWHCCWYLGGLLLLSVFAVNLILYVDTCVCLCVCGLSPSAQKADQLTKCASFSVVGVFSPQKADQSTKCASFCVDVFPPQKADQLTKCASFYCVDVFSSQKADQSTKKADQITNFVGKIAPLEHSVTQAASGAKS